MEVRQRDATIQKSIFTATHCGIIFFPTFDVKSAPVSKGDSAINEAIFIAAHWAVISSFTGGAGPKASRGHAAFQIHVDMTSTEFCHCDALVK
jgi:hypothetical protein